MWRRHLVAAFVLYHCVAITLSALPTAGEGLNRKGWSDPTVQDEFDRWAGWLGMPSKTLQDEAFAVAKRAAKARAALLDPFSDYLAFFGIKQSWKMFVAPHRYPTRFQIQSRAHGEWVTRFFEADPAARWNGDAFDAEIYRSVLFRWGWTMYAGNYKLGCRRLAERLFAEDPDVTEVRCRIEKVRTLSPADVRAGKTLEPRWVSPFVVKR